MKQKLMKHDLISFIEHIRLVLIVKSLVSTFGDGQLVMLCLELASELWE